MASGARLETYVIEGERGSGEIALNGPAARLGCVGDLVIIASYADYADADAVGHTPTIILVDDKNRPVGPRLSSENAR